VSHRIEDVLIVGAGQGGLSASHYLTRAGCEHRILERGSIANAWSAHRWDSFCLVTPNWTINLPGKPYEGNDPNGFMGRDQFVAYMKNWAESFGAPVVQGVDVRRVVRAGKTFRLITSKGEFRARTVVVATATYQHPRILTLARQLPSDRIQLRAESYRSPRQAPDVSVLIVGGGQTGCQITEDFLRSGRKTYLCVAPAPVDCQGATGDATSLPGSEIWERLIAPLTCLIIRRTVLPAILTSAEGMGVLPSVCMTSRRAAFACWADCRGSTATRCGSVAILSRT